MSWPRHLNLNLALLGPVPIHARHPSWGLWAGVFRCNGKQARGVQARVSNDSPSPLTTYTNLLRQDLPVVKHPSTY